MKNKLKKTDRDKKSKNILAELFADDPEFLKMHQDVVEDAVKDGSFLDNYAEMFDDKAAMPKPRKPWKRIITRVKKKISPARTEDADIYQLRSYREQAEKITWLTAEPIKVVKSKSIGPKKKRWKRKWKTKLPKIKSASNLKDPNINKLLASFNKGPIDQRTKDIMDVFIWEDWTNNSSRMVFPLIHEQ